mgnify:CR=1 FL=1
MLDKLKEYFATKKVEKAIKNSPIHQVAIQAGIKANKETGLDRLAEKSEKVRSLQGEYILKEVDELARAKDPFILMREKYANEMLSFCMYQVLVLDKKVKDDPTGLLKFKGISGELINHQSKLIKLDKDLKQKFHGLPSDNLDKKAINEYIMGFYKNMAWRFRVMDAIRRHLKDFNSNLEKDWMMPFRFCMCVWYENSFRKMLKLKPLISDINNIQYSTFMNTVVNGHKYPDLEFLEGYKDNIKDKSLYWPTNWFK